MEKEYKNIQDLISYDDGSFQIWQDRFYWETVPNIWDNVSIDFKEKEIEIEPKKEIGAVLDEKGNELEPARTEPAIMETRNIVQSIKCTPSVEQKKKELEVEIQKIKEECNKDILSKYSATDQANMTANVARINALATREKREFTGEENKTLDTADAMFLYVNERLEKCKKDIIKITNNK